MHVRSKIRTQTKLVGFTTLFETAASTFFIMSSLFLFRLVAFKRWLWAVIERMSGLEKQDLVYFWTGSPALPASEEGFQPMPSVTIR